MIAEVQLSVNGVQFVDLDAVDSIPLSARFSDIERIGDSVAGSYTQTFRIPDTARNRAIFGPAEDVNISDVPGFYQKLPAVLSVDTIPLYTGFVQLKATYTRVEKLTEYEIVFSGETVDLSKAIGEKKLSDLAALITLNHTVDYAAIISAGDDYRYALTDRGQKWSQQGEAGTRPVNSPTAPVYPADMTPLVCWKFIMQSIISEAGFTYEASALDTILAGYWMPWINSQYNKSGIADDGYFFKAEMAADETLSGGIGLANYVTLVESFDNNGDFAAGVYTAPFAGLYTFRVWATLELPDPYNNPIGVMRLRNPDDNTNWWSSYNFPLVATSYPDFPVCNLQQQTPEIFLAAGDKVALTVGVSFGPIDVNGVSGSYETGTGFQLIATSQELSGGNIDMQLSAPDMKQIDFIKDVVRMHCAVIDPDRNIPNKLRIENASTYIGSGATLNWTSKLDVSKEHDVVVKPTTDLLKKLLTWTYKAGGEYLSKLFTDAGRTYGQYVVEGYTVSGAQQPNQFANGEDKVELVTASTPCNTINGTSIIIPKFLTDSGAFVAPGPRVVYISSSANVQLYNDALPGAAVTQVNLVNHYSDSYPSLNDFDLNFAPETPLHYINANPANNLFNLYHRDFFNGFYSPLARVMEAYFHLTVADVLTLDFRDKIWIDHGSSGAYWRVLEVDNYQLGVDMPTKVRLMKIVDTTADCDYTIDHIEDDGHVIFLDSAGDESDGSRVCCERYGYDWSDNSAQCRGPRNNAAPPPSGHALGNYGIGFSGGDVPQSSNYALILAAGLGVSADLGYSILAGTNLFADAGNYNLAMIGENLRLRGGQFGAALFGKNADVSHPGLHIGGGWFTDDRSDVDGRAQFGFIPVMGQGDFTVSGTTIELFIEGVANKRISLDVNSTWMARVYVAVHRFASGDIPISGSFAADVTIAKTAGGVARVGLITPVSSDEFDKLTLSVSGVSGQHKLFISKVGGTGFPFTSIRISGVVQYVQVKS